MLDIAIIASIAVSATVIIVAMRAYVQSRLRHYESFKEDRNDAMAAVAQNVKAQPELKSFIYLDEYKMASISSQVFEGHVDSVIQRAGSSSRTVEGQEGPIISGRTLEYAIGQIDSRIERKVLLDYAYLKFEEELHTKGLITNISAHEPVSKDMLLDASVVKVTGTALMVDYESLIDMIESFDKFADALSYVVSHPLRQEADRAKEQLKQIKDRNERSRLKQLLDSKVKGTNILAEAGLDKDPKMLKDLGFLLKYGYGDQFELQINIDGAEEMSFIAWLDRNWLREDAPRLVQKYSVTSQKDFTMLGIVTRSGDLNQKYDVSGEANDPIKMREAITNMAFAIANIEADFTDLGANHFTIDPIAVYQSLEISE